MAHKLCSAVAAAADDVAAVFGDDAADLTALFMVWSLDETDRYALLHTLRLLTYTALFMVWAPEETVRCALSRASRYCQSQSDLDIQYSIRVPENRTGYQSVQSRFIEV